MDYKDGSKTENTRVSYPIYHIDNYEPSSAGGHPKNIIFLTADAFGVLPPVAKLTKEQAMYYFLSGYTAKVAGTERGITEPVATFSACFGEPFMPLHPTVYAKLLGEKIDKHNVSVLSGKYRLERRRVRRRQANEYQSYARMHKRDPGRQYQKCEFENFEKFNLAIPKELAGVETKLLNPINTWNAPGGI